MTRETARSDDAARERAVLVGLTAGGARREQAERSIDELSGLATAAGADVVLTLVQDRVRPDPATFLGKGKVQTLAAACAEIEADFVVVDNELSPAQLRNLEKALVCRVLDRTQLILDIFAKRARTREGKLQVELAQLDYLLPRLVGRGVELSRLGGGIGTRGPGETKLETDRRRIRQRIASLRRELEKVRERRSRLRDRRQQGEVPMVALVGYTNAGKTTLFNAVTRERAVTSDALFVTLDPLMRQVRLGDGQQILLSDTVGFIDRLPHGLIAAFRATLEEVADADLLLHVVDAASEDRERNVEAVHRVLDEVGALGVPTLLVWNKCDLVGEHERVRLRQGHPGAVLVAAATGDGLDRLRAHIASRLGLDIRRVTLEFDAGDEHDQARMRWLYRVARVQDERHEKGRVAVDVELPRRLLERMVAEEAERRERQ